ncbi:MAG: exo-alpha-sialidase [Planctomycetes bacterium]|nr:exo-alpha-sialidase [Planctomycetota bacterium]MCB9891710.1 exo-alpha-sialidase [Planctomycetota bacterium]MCB9918733.1 exo-alpha-sialidase [Planctomycetota bacterium]
MKSSASLIPTILAAITLTASAPLISQVSFGAAQPLTTHQSAIKAKLMRLVKTKNAARDGRLVVAYADVGHSQAIWTPRDGLFLPRDIFVRYSDDDGVTWSVPVNVSRTADKYSMKTDWSGDGLESEYWGDSGKPTTFNHGDSIVVTWEDKYAPESTWVWGASGVSTVQGSIGYEDPATAPNLRYVPFSCIYAAISLDGGETWTYGVVKPPLQLTYGRRDVAQNVVKGIGANWIITWQEDPLGLQPGEGEGPGEGYSGAKVSQGTDIWYTWTTDLVGGAELLRTNRVPLTDQSVYDTTGTNGFVMIGDPGSIQNHGASRANTSLVKVGSDFLSVIAYEETKATPDLEKGKTVQYHAFPFTAPTLNGVATARYGSSGTTLSDETENGRRVRFVTQGSDGTDPAISIFWKQGTGSQGAPSDILCRTANALTESTVAASPLLNLSSSTPTATSANLLDATSKNALEDARAHRAWIRGQFLVIGWSYTPDGQVARYSDLENYNFWIRRSFDGGKTWLAPQNLSHITNTKINVLEPRLVGPANTGAQDDKSFVVAWGTETNVYEGLAVAESLDGFITRTRDQGATWEKVMPVAMTGKPEYELQLRMNDDVGKVYATWMRSEATAKDLMFAASGNPLWIDVDVNPVTIGTTCNLTLHAPGCANDLYLLLASFDTYPGTPTSTGILPLNVDAMMVLAATVPNVFVNFAGVFGVAETGSASIVVPNVTAIHDMEFWLGFIVWPASTPKLFSNPAIIRID